MSNLYPVRELITETLKGITPQYVEKSNVIVINQKCIRSNKINFKLSRFHNPEKKYADNKIVRVGDILINSTGQGTAGRSVFVRELPSDDIIIVDSHVLIVRVNDFFTAGCLGYTLFSIEPILQTFMEGSTGQGEFDKERLFNIVTGLPSPDNRPDTFSFLVFIDKKIELNNRINAELEAMAKTLYDYWFVQFDFPDTNGKPYKTSGGKMVYNATLKREIPEGWECSKLSELTLLIRRGLSPRYVDDGGIQVLNQKCARQQRILFGDARRHSVVLKEGDERLLCQLDVLVNSTGVGTLGRVAFVKRLHEKATTIDSHVSVVRANPTSISSDYLAWTMLRYQPVIEAAANGSTGQVELSKIFLEDLDIVVPDKVSQQKFETFLNPLIKDIATRELESEELIKLRDWLLPMLMNGQVTVK
jgi:type I restriction enzyme S subunit